MSQIKAWILDLGAGCRAAVGGRELLHLLDRPALFSVPCTPDYCGRIVSWQGQLLPVIDIAAKLGCAVQEAQYVGVIGYQEGRGAYPQFGGLLLAGPPLQAVVSDAQACNLPDDNRAWREVAISCFDHQGTAIPVLNLNRIFNVAAPAVIYSEVV